VIKSGSALFPAL